MLDIILKQYPPAAILAQVHDMPEANEGQEEWVRNRAACQKYMPVYAEPYESIDGPAYRLHFIVKDFYVIPFPVSWWDRWLTEEGLSGHSAFHNVTAYRVQLLDGRFIEWVVVVGKGKAGYALIWWNPATAVVVRVGGRTLFDRQKLPTAIENWPRT